MLTIERITADIAVYFDGKNWNAIHNLGDKVQIEVVPLKKQLYNIDDLTATGYVDSLYPSISLENFTIESEADREKQKDLFIQLHLFSKWVKGNQEYMLQKLEGGA